MILEFDPVAVAPSCYAKAPMPFFAYLDRSTVTADRLSVAVKVRTSWPRPGAGVRVIERCSTLGER